MSTAVAEQATSISTPTRYALSFHEGQAFFKIADAYPTLLMTILEQIQNAIDANATMIKVMVNHKKRQVVVQDNGEGVTPEKFARALTSVCETLKKEDAIGQFGIGLVSPLGKCDSFTFTSTPKSDPKGYTEWNFDCEKIHKVRSGVHIPAKSRKDLCYSRDAQKGVPWRTQVVIHNFKKDRTLMAVDLASLQEHVIDRFNTAMLKKNVVVEATITGREGTKESDTVKPKMYTGQALPSEKFYDPDAGTTVFTLHKVVFSQRLRQGRKPKVLVGELGNDYRFDFATFVRSLPTLEMIDADAVSALTSGVFEGEILTGRTKLHPNRKSFLPGDALVGFCKAINTWYQQTGLKHFEEAKEASKEQRYQDLGLRSMRVLEGLFKDIPDFADIFSLFKQGSIGVNHTDVDAKQLGEQTVPSLSIQGVTKLSGSGGGSEGKEFSEPESEHEKHKPLTVQGPHGIKRRLVKGNSIGLQFSYDADPCSKKLFQLNVKSGILSFNVAHPLWEKCEQGGDRALMSFQEFLAINAIVLESTPDMMRLAVENTLDSVFEGYAFLLVHGDALAGRKFGGRKAKEEKSKEK